LKTPVKISAATVRDDFNDPVAVVHYARAAHNLGLWKSEKLLIERFFPDRDARLLEAGCGAGRVTIGLWELGYHNLVAFDFAEELVDQARALAEERSALIPLHHADATQPLCHLLSDNSRQARPPSTSASKPKCHLIGDTLFGGVLFMFNGLMQIPGRANRRLALQNLAAVCRPGAPLLFTTHDRDHSRVERASWKLEALRWEQGRQDPRLVEFGDRYFEDDVGRTFMHLPDRSEILEDLASTGWIHDFDSMRRDLARESRAVVDFSDECRFWVARRP
jgi:SAM-dependent methyltransferase